MMCYHWVECPLDKGSTTSHYFFNLFFMYCDCSYDFRFYLEFYGLVENFLSLILKL
jgi:hypothetical protein